MIRAALLALGLAGAAQAQTVEPCDWRARLDAVLEPWDSNITTYANGNVQIAFTDTIEPGAGPLHVVVVSPPRDELGARQCRVISLGGGMGFAGLTPSGLQAGYDPSVGLQFWLPVLYFNAVRSDFDEATLYISVNQATGFIGVQLMPVN